MSKTNKKAEGTVEERKAKREAAREVGRELATTFAMPGQEILKEITKEQINRAKTMDRQEVRSVVQMFERLQKLRVGIGNRIKAHERGDDNSDPAFLLANQGPIWEIERMNERVMAAFSRKDALCTWVMSVYGGGPTIAAGLSAHIDFQRCCCDQFRDIKGTARNKEISKADPHHFDVCPGLVSPSHLYSYADLVEPGSRLWKKGMRRPFNLRLKTILLGHFATPLRAAPADLDLSDPRTMYVRLYRERKAQEKRNNRAGMFADQCRSALDRDYRDDADALIWYTGRMTPEDMDAWYALPPAGREGFARKVSKGRPAGFGVPFLPPDRIDKRAMRYSVRIFVSHYHTVGYELYYGKIPAPPYPIAHKGHTHYIPPPLWTPSNPENRNLRGNGKS